MNSYLRLSIVSLFALSLYSCALFSAAGLTSQGQPVKEVKSPLQSTKEGSTINVDHSQWDRLLKKHVDSQGMVDYTGFKEDRSELKSYLKMLSKLEPTKRWSVQELLAFYINTYNAYTVDLILENYPVKSIKDISGPWTRGIVPIGNNNLSLGGIENGILRKMNEARIHFAINCASISCPKLLNEAYTAGRINEQLDRAAKEFINSEKNELDPDKPKLSSIFDWYRKDYLVNGNVDVIGYINQFATTKINPNAELQFMEYDWNLNDQR
ncbi:MAG: DUF547 domain-containing protein [Flavobacteriaceae bacterium]|nr:DUF547 domain-containing protein [Flavobacteriaceae bacterium]